MSQKYLLAPIPLTVGVMLSAAACGHIIPEDAQHTSSGSTGTGGTFSGSGGSGNTGGTGVITTCGDQPTQRFDSKSMPGYTAPPHPGVEQVFDSMDLNAKVIQMQGIPEGDKDYQDIERSQDVTVSGESIRGYRYRDAGHGVNLDAGQDNRPKDANNFATNFPQASTRGASWDVDLEWRLGEAMGDETAASKNNMLLAPCMNIIRHAFWGRTQETYGEDTYHVGRMAAALTAGIQQHVAACAKHFAANNVERNRVNQDALMNEQTLREIYGRHFEMVVQDGGVSCIMASYNLINGTKSTLNDHLLTTILRGPLEQGGMAFRGTVISDWWAMPGWQGPVADNVALDQARDAAIAGLDIEVPWTLNYKMLPQLAMTNPDVARAIDRSAKTILEQKFRFNQAYGDGNSSQPWTVKGSTRSSMSGASIATNQEHLDLAEEAVIKSAVLLDNGPAGSPVLPLSGVSTLSVVGDDVRFVLIDTSYPKQGGDVVDFARHVPAGDRGSSRVNADPAQSIGPADGLAIVGANHGVTSVSVSNTAAGAAPADATVVVVGYTPGDEGEEYAIPAGGDRASYDLPHAQNQLVADVLTANEAAGTKTAIIVQSGSIVDLPWLAHTNKNQATIWAGYAGMRAGLAYAKLIFADNGTNFSGKMPMAWPRGTIPYAFKDGVDPSNSTSTAMGYFFGYREYDRRKAAGEPVDLWFEFGRGLSYTNYSYGNLSVPCAVEGITKKGIIDVTVDVTNTGPVAGEEVVMLFVKGPPASGPGDRAVKELKSFAKVRLAPAETKTVKLPVRIQDLRHWQGDANGQWVIDSGTYTVLVGGSGADADLDKTTGTFVVHD